MPVPDLDTWRARWQTPDEQHLGVRPLSVAKGHATFAIDLPYGDERDADPLFTTSALTYVTDVSALSAVMAHLDETEQPNGTASLHLNYIATPTSAVTVEATVFGQNSTEAIIDIAGREADGRVVLRGLVTFSVRQRASGGGA